MRHSHPQNNLQKPGKNKKNLESLVGIALTLPGISTAAHAQKPISTSPSVDAFYSRYSENHDKYKVDSYSTNLLFPLSSNWEFGLGALREAMTGASPSGSYPNNLIPNNQRGGFVVGSSPIPAFVLVETKTQQSIIETRNQVSGLLNYYLPDGKVSLDAGYSSENDFESFFANVNTEWDFNKKNTVVFAGFGVDYNISRPVLKDLQYIYTFVFSPSTNVIGNRGKYNTERFVLGVKQDINKDFYVQQNAELILDNGDLFDPYKSIAFTGPNSLNWPNSTFFGEIFVGSDRRPHRKITGALVTNLVHYLPCLNSSLHFSYRYAANSWNIHSSTFELGYYQTFWKTWEIAPKARYYTQDRASFYALSYYTEQPSAAFPFAKKLKKNKGSSDYRLSNFGSIGYDITLSKTFQDPNVKLSATFGFTKNAIGFGWTKNKGPKNPSNKFHQKFVAINLSSDFPGKLSFKKKDECCNPTLYKAGEFIVQPLIISFTGLTLGRKHEDTRFTATPYPPIPSASIPVARGNMYRNQRALGLTDIHRNGIGYDFQLGYVLEDNLEVFTDIGFTQEKGTKEPVIINPYSYKFKKRTTPRTSFGARYYVDMQTIFTPFVGFMGGVEWQRKTKATVYGYNPFDVSQFLVPGQKVGTFEIFKARNLFSGALLAGLDYRFNEHLAVSLSTGLYYYKRNKGKKLPLTGLENELVPTDFGPVKIPGKQAIHIFDNKNKIIIPVSISLKIIL
jgi:opacity protein-like surface antigen